MRIPGSKNREGNADRVLAIGDAVPAIEVSGFECSRLRVWSEIKVKFWWDSAEIGGLYFINREKEGDLACAKRDSLWRRQREEGRESESAKERARQMEEARKREGGRESERARER